MAAAPFSVLQHAAKVVANAKRPVRLLTASKAFCCHRLQGAGAALDQLHGAGRTLRKLYVPSPPSSADAAPFLPALQGFRALTKLVLGSEDHFGGPMPEGCEIVEHFGLVCQASYQRHHHHNITFLKLQNVGLPPHACDFIHIDR